MQTINNTKQLSKILYDFKLRLYNTHETNISQQTWLQDPDVAEYVDSALKMTLMSLYWHYDGSYALDDALINRVLNNIYNDARTHIDPA